MKATVRAIALSIVALGAPLARAQTAPVPPPAQPGSAPPVLSTVPSPPAGTVPQPVQMSGLPLQVGDLPPGIVAVRVIRRTFAENIADQAVELRTGGTGPVLTAVTNKEGRAQFDRLTIGETVRVRAAVDDEVLESQSFELPAQGGVRLVLVAGVGAGSPGGEGVSSAAAAAPAAGTAQAPPATATTVVERIGAGPVALLIFASAVAVIVWRRQPRQTLATPRRRAETFEALVRLEKDFVARRVGEAAYQTRREELIARLVSLDLVPLKQVRHGFR